jgi:hypothetical protein
MPGFQIGEVFTESLRFLLKQLRPLFILAAVPYALFLLLQLLAASLMPEDTGTLELRLEAMATYEYDGLVVIDPATGERRDLAPELYLGVLTLLLQLVVLLPFNVAWLRYTLLGPRFQRIGPIFGVGSREVRFLGYNVGLVLIMLAGAGIASAVAGLLGAATGNAAPMLVIVLATVVLFAWLTARLYFVFPPLAMDLPGGFARAWTESRGQGFKLVLLTVMVLLVLGLPVVVVGAILAGAPLVAAVVGTGLQIIVDGGLWTALAFAYWRTTGIPGQQQGPGAPSPGPTAT